jgi:4-hydroxy-tetrahydrodipicolinate synthase
MLTRRALALALFTSVAAAGIALAQDPCCSPCCGPRIRLPFCGIYPTVLTPWTCAGAVDVPALACQLEYQLNGGVDGLLVLGTIGEGAYTNDAGRAMVIATAVAQAKGRPVVAGIHTADPRVARAQMKQAKELGAAAVLVKYTGCPCTEIAVVRDFYRRLTLAPAAERLPVFVYYYPSQTKNKFTPEEVASILALPGIAGIKESILDLKHVERQMALVRGQGRIFLSGTALNLTQFIAIGGHGAMCPEAALMPCRTARAFREAYDLGRCDCAREIQKDLFVVAPLLQRVPVSEGCARALTMCSQDRKSNQFMGPEASPAKLKAALSGLGVGMNALVAPPQKQLDGCDQLQVDRALLRLRELAP